MGTSYEIERKFRINKLPDDLESFDPSYIEQGYLCVNPVIRVRRRDDKYILTYKSGGLMKREEYEHLLTKEGFEHLIKKADGIVISKTRYFIPDDSGYTIELDVFHGDLEGFIMAEVEFESEEAADSYTPPSWFGEDVTKNPAFHNSNISRMDKAELEIFLEKYSFS